MKNEGLKNLLDVVGGIAAFLTVFVYLVLIIAGQGWFTLPDTVLNILNVCKTWAPLVVVAITGLEFVSNKNFIIKLIFIIAVAAVVIFMFFPATWTQFVGIVNGAVGA